MSFSEFQKRVFIFGAGASAGSGAPLMNTFLDKAEYLYRKFMIDTNYISPPKTKEYFELVFQAIDSMQRLHSKSNINLDNIGDVFGAFEIARMIKKLVSFPSEKIDELTLATSILIAHTLEYSCEFELGRNGYMPKGEFRQFFDSLKSKSISEKDGTPFFQNNIFITFNYDVCLDAALHYLGYEIDYGLAEDLNPNPKSVKLLKLHGSINWAECLDSNCGKMFAINLKDFAPKQINLRLRQQSVPQYDQLFFTPTYHDYKVQYRICNCANALRKYRPVIVPPTWNKSGFHQQISNVWRHAANAIGQAEYIYIIGYSMPETDVFFRLLYSLGSESSTRLKKFLVINPDEQSKMRFDRIVSQGRFHRYEFRSQRFSKALETLF